MAGCLLRLSAAITRGKRLGANLWRNVLSHARCLGRHPTCVLWRAHSPSLSASPLQESSEWTNKLAAKYSYLSFLFCQSLSHQSLWFFLLHQLFWLLVLLHCKLLSVHSFFLRVPALLCFPLLSVCLSLFFLNPLDLQLSVKFHPGGCCAWINQSWLAFSLSAPRWLIFLVRYNLMLYPISSRAN